MANVRHRRKAFRGGEIFTDFIVDYLNRNGRWASPKYLAGESYGTTRGAATAHKLFSEHGVELNGLILISSALNFQTIGLESDTWVFLHEPAGGREWMLFDRPRKIINAQGRHILYVKEAKDAAPWVFRAEVKVKRSEAPPAKKAN